MDCPLSSMAVTEISYLRHRSVAAGSSSPACLAGLLMKLLVGRMFSPSFTYAPSFPAEVEPRQQRAGSSAPDT